MASGSSGRVNPGSKGFDFASDDILCSYEDYGNQENSNGSHSDPGVTPSKDFHKSRLTRPAVYSAPAYSQPEDSFSQDLIASVEITMKKYTDNLMRFLEGISSRMSQLELYCYNLDKSIGEMRSELTRDHGDADTKLKSIEKHLQEVHRSVQILRDKQELAETQKELAKLQTSQKESSSVHSQSKEDRAASPAPAEKKPENSSDASNKQLALALPHQVIPQQQTTPLPVQTPVQGVSQQHAYYVQPVQMPAPPGSQYLPVDPQARMTQLQAVTAPQPLQPLANQSPVMHPYPQHQQQQWARQPTQQLSQLPVQQSAVQSQMRPAPGGAVYPPYPQGQPTNPPPEALPSSMAMQLPYSGLPPTASSRADTIPYGYSGQGGTGPQQSLPQTIPGSYGGSQGQGDAYGAGGPHAAVPPRGGYIIYDREGGRVQHPQQQPHFPHGGTYPPSNVAPQSQPPPNPVVRTPSHSQYPRNHPYSDLIEKLMNMGFRGDHVASVIQRMEESGQPVDFNSVLDRLNVHSAGGPQRGWSG
ncbi:hypothetical protein MLD38_025860 [Melastoma candidum]|uniref:Uncharacterized protein n=1 Tax=Melastoma candidum TaxID=119954 RepID=A0ACB9NXN2_9MYRT|nr:hypothetical protein MLD38_025860 [Melastoma candidum]